MILHCENNLEIIINPSLDANKERAFCLYLFIIYDKSLSDNLRSVDSDKILNSINIIEQENYSNLQIIKYDIIPGTAYDIQYIPLSIDKELIDVIAICEFLPGIINIPKKAVFGNSTKIQISIYKTGISGKSI